MGSYVLMSLCIANVLLSLLFFCTFFLCLHGYQCATEQEHKCFCYLRRNKGYFLRNNECSCGPRERIDVIKGLVSLFGNVPLEVA